VKDRSGVFSPLNARRRHASLILMCVVVPLVATACGSGEADRADPYDGPMIAVSTAKAGEGEYAGDGDPTPVTFRGTTGEAVPITVFQQVVLPKLGTVITWTEGGHDVAVFGRLWTKAKTAELVALADKLEFVDPTSWRGASPTVSRFASPGSK
jgi:hypothetical protein